MRRSLNTLRHRRSTHLTQASSFGIQHNIMTRQAALLLCTALLSSPFISGCEGDNDSSDHDADVRSEALVHLDFARAELPGAQNLYVTISEIQLKRASTSQLRALPLVGPDHPIDDTTFDDDSETQATPSQWKVVFAGPVTFDLLHPNLGTLQSLGDTQATSTNYDALAFTIESATLVRNGQVIPVAIDPAFHAGITVAQPFAIYDGTQTTITLQLDAIGSVVETPGMTPVLRPVATAAIAVGGPV